MLIASDFKKSFFISILGHLACFGFISFSFCRIYPNLSNFSLCFLGQTLRNCEVSQVFTRDSAAQKNFTQAFLSKGQFQKKISNPIRLKVNYYLKPQLIFSAQKDKPSFLQSPQSISYPQKESVIMLRPLLPYYFMLFFNDRKSVHLELQFCKTSDGKRSYTIIKRKITSGNLEADLLSMRYISHYLFIQKNQSPYGSWQTIKIELCAK